MSANPFKTTNPGLHSIEIKLYDKICEEMSRFGILCRVFSRVKSEKSVKEKFSRKGDGYYNKNKMMQDLFGIRIVAYFYEDLDFIEKLLSKQFHEVDRNVDKGGLTEFKPLPRNIVYRLPDSEVKTMDEIKSTYDEYKYIDSTFEIQLRSVLSEGWHEVDHVLRYKCHEEWNDIPEYERMLNGIYATLETSDKALKAMFDEVAYRHYKNRNITGMLRTKFRLEILPYPLSEELSKILSTDGRLWRKIHKIDRKEFLIALSESNIYLPITFDNLVFVINRMYLDNDNIRSLEPYNVKNDLGALRVVIND